MPRMCPLLAVTYAVVRGHDSSAMSVTSKSSNAAAYGGRDRGAAHDAADDRGAARLQGQSGSPGHRTCLEGERTKARRRGQLWCKRHTLRLGDTVVCGGPMPRQGQYDTINPRSNTRKRSFHAGLTSPA